MAVTAIWDVKGRVDQVIRYATNPEKTTGKGLETMAALHAVEDVLEYAADQMKTEQRLYVTGINCDPEIAPAQFQATKRLWKKTGGIVAFHGYQSFRPGEADPKTAHEIGVKLAQELWGDRFEVVVATHLNTDHCHNHFVLNSVSFTDGRRYYDQKRTYRRMREVSDRLCREYGLSVVKQPEGRSKSYGEWQAEKEGRPTHRGSIRADIDRAIRASTTQRDFLRVMTEMGYEFKTRAKDGQPLKYPALKPPGAKGYFRFHKLGTGYSLEEIKKRILQNIRKEVPFPEAEHHPPRRYRLRGKPRKKLTGLQALYFRYCYELHIIVKRPASVKRVSFLLREDVAKLERLDRETLFLAREGITTMEQLEYRQGAAESEIEALTVQRNDLRKELRRLTRKDNQPAAGEVREQIGQLSQRLKKLRKEVALCEGIALRSGRVKENLEQLLTQQNTERKEKNRDELPRRRGGTGRSAESGNR